MKKGKLKFNKRMRMIAGAIISLVVFAVLAMVADNPAIASSAFAMIPIWGSIKDGTFEALSKEQEDALKEDEITSYYNDLRKWEQKELEKKIATNVSKEDLAEFEKQMKETYQKQVDALLKSSIDQGKVLRKLMENMSGAPMTTGEKGQIHKFIADNEAKIKEIHASKNGMIEFTTKAVGSLTTGSATNPDDIPELVGTQVAPAGVINLMRTFVDRLITVFRTTLAAYPYTESVPKDGNYAFVAEAGTKSQIDFKIETRYAQPVKVAAYEVLTDESIQDIQGMQSIATDYLRKKHDLKRQNGILFGTGVSPNPKGATVYGRSFVAGSMANAIVAPNFMDVVNATITDIYTTHNYTDEEAYMANLVMINPVDFYIELVSAKDANGLPLYPQAGLFNIVQIGGATIMPFRDIPSGKIFTADMKRYNATNYVPYTVRIGWINDQLITNQFTMVGESRFHAFVKNLDEQAFIYDTIATIETAITAP